MREVVAGASSAFVIKVIAAVSGLGLSIALARTIGAEGAGVYYLAFTITPVAATVARLGLDNVVVRLVAGGRGAVGEGGDRPGKEYGNGGGGGALECLSGLAGGRGTGGGGTGRAVGGGDGGGGGARGGGGG
jgi:hypothetical protein